MAFTPSRARIAPCAAEKESTYGTNPTIAGADDGFNTIDSVISASPEVQNTEFRNHGASLTRGKNVIGQRIMRMNFSTMLQGSGTAGTAVQGVNDVLQCSGLTETVSAATSVTYAPSTIAAQASATITTDHNGKTFVGTGCYADATFSATAGAPTMCRFAAQGIYNAPALGTIASWAVGTTGVQRAEANLGITATLDNGTDAWTTPTIASYEITLGNQIVRIPDMLAATGLKRLLLADRDPRMTLGLVTDYDTTGTLIQNNEFYTNWLASTTWDIEIVHGATAGNINTWAVPTGQIVDVQDVDSDGVRITNVTCKVQSDTPEAELSLVQT